MSLDILIANNSEYKKCRPCWASLQFLGLKDAGKPAVLKQLMFGGKVSLQCDDDLLTKTVTLLVGQGGLRNKTVSASVKNLFKNEILHVLVGCFSDVPKPFTGRIDLHYHEGILKKADLIFN